MKKSILCLSILFAVYTSTSTAQEPSGPSNGIDADLYNGTIYNFGSAHIKGHQYLENEAFETGSIEIDAHTFSDLLLNYDIFHQEILFKSGEGFQEKLISLPVGTIKSFSIGPRSFIVVQEENWEVKIYETIGEQDTAFFRSWSKELKTTNDNSIFNYEFSKPSRITYLSDGESLHKLRWRKDVLEVFPETSRSDIKKFMRKNRIRFRKASSNELRTLINYCYTL